MAASSGFVREAYFQKFWMPPDPQLPTLGPLLFTDAEVTVLSDIFASYTDDIVGASVDAAGIQTSCFIDSQVGSVQEETSATINKVGFFCVWVSAAGDSVETIPGAFFDFLTDNVDVLTTDMASQGLEVIESYPPMARSITAVPTPAPSIVSDPVSAGPSFAREIFNQEFSVSADPSSDEPAPLFFTEPQLFAFATILADYTSNYVADPSSAADIQTVCFVDEQTGYVQEETGATILNIGYFCNWISETGSVESLPQTFVDYVTNNLEALKGDLFAEGINVLEAFAPYPRAPPTGIPTVVPPMPSATDPPLEVTTSFVREIFNQDFWVPSDPEDPSLPIFYKQQQATALQRILSNYTAEYVDTGIEAEQIRTICFADELTGFLQDGAPILTVGYFCTWSSDFVNVEGLPQAFVNYFTSTENLNVLKSDMISQGLPVIEAYPPDVRAPPTAAPALADPTKTATVPTLPTATEVTADPATSPVGAPVATSTPALDSSSASAPATAPLAPNVILVPVPAPVAAPSGPTTPPVPFRSPSDSSPTAPTDSSFATAPSPDTPSTTSGASRTCIRSSYTVLLTAILLLYIP